MNNHPNKYTVINYTNNGSAIISESCCYDNNYSISYETTGTAEVELKNLKQTLHHTALHPVNLRHNCDHGPENKS